MDEERDGGESRTAAHSRSDGSDATGDDEGGGEIPEDVLEGLSQEARESITGESDAGGSGGVFDGAGSPVPLDAPIEKGHIDPENALFVVLGAVLTLAIFWQLLTAF